MPSRSSSPTRRICCDHCHCSTPRNFPSRLPSQGWVHAGWHDISWRLPVAACGWARTTSHLRPNVLDFRGDRWTVDKIWCRWLRLLSMQGRSTNWLARGRRCRVPQPNIMVHVPSNNRDSNWCGGTSNVSLVTMRTCFHPSEVERCRRMTTKKSSFESPERGPAMHWTRFAVRVLQRRSSTASSVTPRDNTRHRRIGKFAFGVVHHGIVSCRHCRVLPRFRRFG